MNQLTHLLRADVRRFRALIALWIVLAGAGVALDAIAPFAFQRPDRLPWLSLAARLVQLADGLLALALVALVVQAHPLVGSDAFWTTRPIRWSSLLRSKLLLLGAVLVVVPIGFEVMMMQRYDVPSGAMARAVAQMLLFRTAGLFVVIAVAALTPNVARFALAGGGLLLVAAVGTAAGNLLIARGRQRYGFHEYGPDELGVAAGNPDGTWALVAATILIASMLALLVMQYRARALARAAAAGIAGALLAVVVGTVWPWTLFATTAGVETEATRPIRLAGEPESVAFDTAPSALEPGRWRVARAVVRAHGVPAGSLAAATLLRASIDQAGGRVTSPGQTSSSLLSLSDRGPDEGPLTVAIREVLAVPYLGTGPRRGPAAGLRAATGRAAVFVSQKSDTGLDAVVSGNYRGEFAIALTQMEIVATLPISAGAVFRDGAFGAVIDSVAEEESRLRVRGRTSRVLTVFDRTPRPSYRFFIRNRARGEAFDLDKYDRPALMGWGALLITSGFEIYATDLIFRWHDAAWLSGAELVVVRSTYRGSVMRTLEMTGVKVPEQP